jgi:hypothetical protein
VEPQLLLSVVDKALKPSGTSSAHGEAARKG